MSNDNENHIQSGLQFFSNTITSINMRRMKINQTKGFAKFVLKKAHTKNNIYKLDPSLGILSFGLYHARLASNLGILTAYFNSNNKNEQVLQSNLTNLFYEIINDIAWGTINLVQFFWWTFRKSVTAGMYGVLLEGVGMLFDEVIMLIQFSKSMQQHKLDKENATSSYAKKQLEIAWTYRKINLLRSSLHITLFALIFIIFGVGLISFPISPIIYSVNFISTSLRISLLVMKNKQEASLMQCNNFSSQKILEYKRKCKLDLMQQINHFFHLIILIPLVLVLFGPLHIAFTVSAMLLVFLSDYIVDILLSKKNVNANTAEKTITAEATQKKHISP